MEDIAGDRSKEKYEGRGKERKRWRSWPRGLLRLARLRKLSFNDFLLLLLLLPYFYIRSQGSYKVASSQTFLRSPPLTLAHPPALVLFFLTDIGRYKTIRTNERTTFSGKTFTARKFCEKVCTVAR